MIKGDEKLNQKDISSFPVRKHCFTYSGQVASNEMNIE